MTHSNWYVERRKFTSFNWKAEYRTDEQLSYALKDIKETLVLHKDKPVTDPYVIKLYEERDSILGEISRRRGY